MKAPKRKRDHYRPAVLALVSLSCGIASIIVMRYWPTISSYWLNVVIYACLFFFCMSVLLGGYSLLIKQNARAWTALVIGSIFIILLLVSFYLMSKMCVIC